MRRSTNLKAICAGLAVMAMLFLSACNKLDSIKADEEIGRDTQSEIRKLNDRLIAALRANKTARVLAFFPDEMKQEARANLTEVAALYQKNLAAAPLRVFHQYHVRSFRSGSVMPITQSQANGSDFELRFSMPCTEYVATIFAGPDSGIVRTATTVFGKDKAGVWKLHLLHLGTLSVLGMDALYYYRQAQGMYDEGNLIEAARLYEVCAQLMKPAGQGWTYIKEQEVATLSRTIHQSLGANWKFPFTSEVGGEPVEFLGVTSVIDTGSRLLIPQIVYATRKNIGDTAALARQCDEIHPYIHLVFPGITRYNKRISYVVSDSRSQDSASYQVLLRKVADGPPRHSALIRDE